MYLGCLDAIGGVWTSLGMSECIQVIWSEARAGCHPCRCRVSVAHGGSRIDVVGVREQLGDQGSLCVEVCCCMGHVVPPNRPLVGGTPCLSMGRVRSGWLSKIWCS